MTLNFKISLRPRDDLFSSAERRRVAREEHLAGRLSRQMAARSLGATGH